MNTKSRRACPGTAAGAAALTGGAGEFQPKSLLAVPEHRQVDPATAFKQLDEIAKWNADINLETVIAAPRRARLM